MTVIDAHHHLWDPELRDYPWMKGLDALERPFGPAELRDAIRGTPVTQTIVVQADTSDEETDWLIELAVSTPEIVGVVGWADLTDRGVGDRLAELVDRSRLVRGIRHLVQDEADPRWLARPDVIAGLGAVRDAGLAYDLLIRRAESPAAVEAVRAVPDLTFIVDHAAKPGIAAGEWEVWHADLAALAAHENVYCKISGLVTEASHTAWRDDDIVRYIHAVLELFGPERCMFGSDWPVCLLAAPYTDVLGIAGKATAAVSPHERDAIYGGTARAAYGLLREFPS